MTHSLNMTAPWPSDFNDHHLHLPQSSTCTAKTLLFKWSLPLKPLVMFGSLHCNCIRHPRLVNIRAQNLDPYHGRFWVSKLQCYWPLHHYSFNFIPSVMPWNWLRNPTPPHTPWGNLTCTHPTHWDRDFLAAQFLHDVVPTLPELQTYDLRTPVSSLYHYSSVLASFQFFFIFLF